MANPNYNKQTTNRRGAMGGGMMKKRPGYRDGKKVVKARDINKSGSIEGWETARAKGMAKGMKATFKAKRGGKA